MGGGAAKGPESKQLEDEFENTGGCGKYQYLLGFIVILGMFTGGFVVHGLALLEMEPNALTGYMCPVSELNQTLIPCSHEQFCENPDYLDPKRVNFDGANTNLYNWYTRYKMVCIAHIFKPMVATVCLLSIALSCLFVPRLGDLYGRKPIYLFSIGL